MLDDLFEDINMTAFAITYVVGIILLLFMKSRWVGTSMEMSWLTLAVFAVILLPINFVILRWISNKE